MAKKPDLALITTTPITVLPPESLEDFKTWVIEEGVKPSVSLRKLMKKYNCPKPDPSIPMRLLELTYPDVDFARNGFRFKVIDSAYPDSDVSQFSDEDFDSGVYELLTLPLGW